MTITIIYNYIYSNTVEPLNNGQVGALTLVHYSEVVLYWGDLVNSKLYTDRIIYINSGFVEKKWTTLVKMCFYCFMPRFIHAGITCTSSAHKHPAHLSAIGGAFLLEKYHLVHADCLLSRIRRLSAIRE